MRAESHPRGSSDKPLALEMRISGQKSQVTSQGLSTDPRTQFCSSHFWGVMPHKVCDVNCVRWNQDRPWCIRQVGFIFQDHACHSILTNSKKGGCCLFIKKTRSTRSLLFIIMSLNFMHVDAPAPVAYQSSITNQLRALGVDFVTADKRPFGLWRFWRFFKKPDGS